MEYINSEFLKQLSLPAKDSHKGENGKLMIIGGSKLFHGASLWALTVASRIVDMVYYSSVAENQKLAEYLERSLYSFILVPNGKEEEYIAETDAVLIGPGMVRGTAEYTGTGESGQETAQKVKFLLNKFPQKQWIIDAGALQAIELSDLQQLNTPIITPHTGEFERLFEVSLKETSFEERIDIVAQEAKLRGIVIVLKGQIDIVASAQKVILNKNGNEGMTKGGTGDVLAGLIAALACKNDPFTAAAVGAFINGLAGDELYQKVGPLFNADDLAKKVPEVFWEEINK